MMVHVNTLREVQNEMREKEQNTTQKSAIGKVDEAIKLREQSSLDEKGAQTNCRAEAPCESYRGD